MSALFKSFFQHFTTCFLGLLSVWTAIYLQDVTRPNLELKSIHTLSKSLSIFRTCELSKPKGYRIICMYFKTTTY